MGVKVAVVGAGSYVFGPSVLSQLYQEEKLDGVTLALVDPDTETTTLMAGVAQRMARENGLSTDVRVHADRESALDGADFVVCCAAPQMQKRFAMDVEIIERYAPGHLITEFGGVAGISYSLRQIALIEELARDMNRLCPAAWLLDVANPLPRVCQAAHEAGVKTAGFCSVSVQGYGMIARIFGGEREDYPFAAAQQAYRATMAGVNHLSWLVALTDAETNADVYPALRRALALGASSGNARSEAMARDIGYLLMPGDDHVRDFLTPEPGTQPRVTPYHGSADERQRRHALLQAIGEGRDGYAELLAHPSWEKPGAFIAALGKGTPAAFNSLNLVNTGQIPDIPNGVFVETPCAADANGPQPETVTLPDAVQPFVARTAAVTDAIVRAARERRRDLLAEAVALDPTILDKAAGREALTACLAAHSDLLPVYS